MSVARWVAVLNLILLSSGYHVVKINYQGRECYVDVEESPHRCFLLPPQTSSWVNARDSCNNLGGRLAYTKDQLSLTIIQLAMITEGWTAAWMGATKHQMNWKWTEQQTGLGRFSAWGPGSPTFEGLGKDCAMVIPSLNFVWTDRPCTYSAGYICETEPDNPLCEAALATDEEVLTTGDRCFIFSFSPNTWYMARQVCRDRGLKMAKLDSDVHRRISVALPGQGSELYGFWFGLSRVMWSWIDGVDVDKTFWGPGEPIQEGDCLQLKRFTPTEYFWADSRCTSAKHYICEIDIDPSVIPTIPPSTTPPSPLTPSSTATTASSSIASTPTSKSTPGVDQVPSTEVSSSTSSSTTKTTSRPKMTTKATVSSSTARPSSSSITTPISNNPPTPPAPPSGNKTSNNRTIPPSSTPLQPPSTTTVRPLNQCALLDLTFMLDSSTGTNPEEWTDILEFAASVLESYEISASCLSLSIVSFGETVSVTRMPGGSGDVVIRDSMNIITRQGGRRDIGFALQSAMTHVYDASRDRQAAPNLIVILSRGSETLKMGADAKETAAVARKAGIILTVIHIGNSREADYVKHIASYPLQTFTRNVTSVDSLLLVSDFVRTLIDGVSRGIIITQTPPVSVVPTLIVSSASSPLPTIDTASGQEGSSSKTIIISTVAAVCSLVAVICIVIGLIALARYRRRRSDETAIIGRDASRLSSRSIKSNGSISPNSTISTPWGKKKNRMRGIVPSTFGPARGRPRAGLANPEANNLFYNSWIIPSTNRR